MGTKRTKPPSKSPKPLPRGRKRKAPRCPEAPGLPRSKPRSKQFGKPRQLPRFDPDRSPIKRKKSVPA